MKLSKIKLNPDNPRIIKDSKFDKLVNSILCFPQMLEKRRLVCVTDTDKKIFPLGGNMRYKALLEIASMGREAVLNYLQKFGKEENIILLEPLFKGEIQDSWVEMADEWTEEQRKEFIIKDNVSFGEWDFDMLANEWNVEELAEWCLDIPNFEIDEEDKTAEAHSKLTDRFIVPPFSILNAREGKWQERKKYWKDLIKDTGITRDTGNQTNTRYRSVDGFSASREDENVGSVLDPVLSEIILKWFGLNNSNTFDCFSGDTIFGYVSSYLGNSFTGIELRQSQVDFNNERTKGFNAKYICDDGRNVLNHIEENSQDLLFSCPPYFDLEVYSDLENDASNQKEYKDFLKILDSAFSNAIKCLKDNRFAVIVCGDVRDKKGNYYRFPDHIKEIFESNGMPLYNELILIDPVGNLQMRVGKYMEHRKVGKTHQNVLVFYKGNPKGIKNIYPKLDFSELENTINESENI